MFTGFLRKHKKIIIFVLSLVLVTGILVLLYYLSVKDPEGVNNIYTAHIFNIVNYPAKLIAGTVPFSVGEVLLYILIILFAASLIAVPVLTIVRSVKNKKFTGKYLIRFFVVILCVACLGVSLFVVNGAFNYNRPSFASLNGYEIKESHVDELKALCSDLLDKANEARSRLSDKEDGTVLFSSDQSGICELALSAYEKIGEKYNMPYGFYPKAKPAIMSDIMSTFRITGIYPYIYPEAIYNKNTPDPALPHTICHEMAHQRGFALEDEANYIGYLACVNSDAPELQYSGYYEMFVYAGNALFGYDSDAYYEIAGKMCDGMRRDMIAESEYWKQYEKKNNPAAVVSEVVNDAYLKINNVDDGIHSYGLVVDLLLAEYRAGKG